MNTNEIFRIHFLPTVWSDCEVLEYNGHFAVVDTGSGPETNDMIQKFLRLRRAEHLDWILLTHFHPDHVGGLRMLLDSYRVDTVYYKDFSGVTRTNGAGKVWDNAGRAAEAEVCRLLRSYSESKTVTVPIEGMKTVKFQGIDLTLFNSENIVRTVYEDPESPLYHQYICNENQNSLMFLFEVYSRSVLMAADITDVEIGDLRLDMMNTRFAREIGRPVDIMKAPHHGYGIGSTEALSIYRPSFGYFTNTEETVRGNTDSAERLYQASPDVRIEYASDSGKTVSIIPDGTMEITDMVL